ncbi:MAG TPA: TcpE family conjugal transfer membrane protein [Acidimicrobiales bacterium]
MPDEREVAQVHCATYTHARRHPMVLGRIAGWTPPFQLSLTQIGVLLVSFYVMVNTWRYWAAPLPSSLALIVGAGVPVGLTWAVRRVRVEGRSLPRAAVGWLALWATPPKGTLRGRPHLDRRAVSLGPVRMNVAAAPPEAP